MQELVYYFVINLSKYLYVTLVLFLTFYFQVVINNLLVKCCIFLLNNIL